MNDAILAILIVVLGVIAFCVPFFTRPRYRILEVEHKNGEIDYTVQFSRVFGLPGTWVIVQVCMGYYRIVLRGCDLEAAKYYVRSFEIEDAKERARKTKRKYMLENKLEIAIHRRLNLINGENLTTDELL